MFAFRRHIPFRTQTGIWYRRYCDACVCVREELCELNLYKVHLDQHDSKSGHSIITKDNFQV